MHIRQLEIFLAIIETGNFSSAAKKLFLSQPTISNHIDQLEEELSARLFVRSGRKTTLTPWGEKFLLKASQMVALKEQMMEEISGTLENKKGIIRIIASSVPAKGILPRLLKRYGDQNPEISFLVTVASSQEAIEALEKGFYDIAFVGQKENLQKTHFYPLLKDELTLITPATEPYLSFESPIAMEDLCKMPFIKRSEGSATGALFQLALLKEKMDYKDLKIPVETSDLDLLISLVEGGMGVAIISSLVAKELDHVLQFSLQNTAVMREYYMAYPNSDFTSPRLKAFVSFVKKEME